ncbi:hypothetical protein IEI94_07430 [Halomonas sp. ML-15]|uniref:hypothetical protein n=1 Tax=Halomonas sp. ML-15 TaxID=2773305 RepID=UPI0017476DA6|nr:hypothetical protein [Halomonas sp. ML-15]MBD3895682.1 hypothetical protein [Halomonas sp. ML-15]
MATGSKQRLPAPRDTLIEAGLMGLALLPTLVSFYISLVTGDGHWFQRSGALMVLFSVGVEYHRKHLMSCQYLSLSETTEGVSTRMARIIIRFWRAVPFACYFAIVVGTLIWSYGDLLFA